jgi:pimeloyl-ACP methyl ester carboxylesterase
MTYLTTKDDVDIYYNDWGTGKPVVLIHGWPLDADMWSEQAVFLAERGYRVIAYDRRGFGRSAQPWSGYDYDTLAADLNTLIEKLELREATLVGFSMGGGEVARYLSRYGTGRIAKAALVSSVTPFLLQTEDNPDGVPQSVFDGILAGLQKDRPDFLASFGKMFYGQGLIERSVSTETLQWTFNIAMLGSYRATLECAKSFATTDFRGDMAAFTIPTLIIHGTSDKTVPPKSSAEQAVKLIPQAKLIEYQGEPHGLHITAKDQLSEDLLAFLQS